MVMVMHVELGKESGHDTIFVGFGECGGRGEVLGWVSEGSYRSTGVRAGREICLYIHIDISIDMGYFHLYYTYFSIVYTCIIYLLMRLKKRIP